MVDATQRTLHCSRFSPAQHTNSFMIPTYLNPLNLSPYALCHFVERHSCISYNSYSIPIHTNHTEVCGSQQEVFIFIYVLGGLLTMNTSKSISARSEFYELLVAILLNHGLHRWWSAIRSFEPVLVTFSLRRLDSIIDLLAFSSLQRSASSSSCLLIYVTILISFILPSSVPSSISFQH